MRTWSRVSILGRMAADPEVIETKTGKLKVQFPVATNRQTITQGGEKVEKADFHRILAWENLGRACKENLHSGDSVFVEGRLQYRSYEKENQKHYVSEISLTDITFLSPKKPSDGDAATGNGKKATLSAKAKSLFTRQKAAV